MHPIHIERQALHADVLHSMTKYELLLQSFDPEITAKRGAQRYDGERTIKGGPVLILAEYLVRLINQEYSLRQEISWESSRLIEVLHGNHEYPVDVRVIKVDDGL